ncbi:MAG TPA: M20/M25/M40 family metallo-hydrolase [Candidatus Limnocylindrales bacterium]|nr:M20/M25/M40 family metallo-hydrolase [Candidatus Limnocylindrales bacterium]
MIRSTGCVLAFGGLALVMIVPRCAGQIIPKQTTPLSRQAPPSGPGVCSPEKSCAEVAPVIIESARGVSPLEENLRYLTDTIGGRVTGSAAADRAVSWAVEAFRQAGVDEVHTEKFTVPVGWSEGATRAEVLSPAEFRLRLVSTGWSPATPEGGITGAVVDVGDGDEAGFARAGAAAKGAIVLVHSKLLVTWDDLDNEYDDQPAIIDRAVKAGAAAIFWMSTRTNLLLYRHTNSGDGKLEELPQAVVAREDALRVARFLSNRQQVQVHLEMPNHISGPVESENVIAEIRGREKPDEFVLLGAHLDSWELGTGALDDGCNAAMVIDAARAIRASGSTPRRSIRFALFTGEEQGMLGSWAYAKAHRDELDQMVAAIIFDNGNGRVTGYSLGGRKDILPAVREALEPIASLGVRDYTLDAGAGTDNFDFLLEGVPTLVANQEPANYMPNYHAASDTFDKVDIPELKTHVAIAAVTAYALADREERIGVRQSRPEIQELMKESGLEETMKKEGIWEMWTSGERGRQ